MNLSGTYETDIRSFEKEFDTEQLEPKDNLQQKIADGVRDGIRRAGMSSSSLQMIDDSSVDNHDGTITAGVYDRQKNRIALAGVEHIAETIDPSVSNVQAAVRDQVEATLGHEQRHQVSCEKAKARGEFGMITAYLGVEADRLFQELMASKGTESFDAYDVERSRASHLASQIGLGAEEVIHLLYEGREAQIVSAAFQSGYLKPELN
jgi:hypothetical protein